jgi:hypothetical protein
MKKNVKEEFRGKSFEHPLPSEKAKNKTGRASLSGFVKVVIAEKTAFWFGNSVPTLSLKQGRAKAKAMGRKLYPVPVVVAVDGKPLKNAMYARKRGVVLPRLIAIIWRPGGPCMHALERCTNLRLGLRLLSNNTSPRLILRLLCDDLPICALVTRGHIGDRGCRGGDDGAAISAPTP